MSKMKCKLWTPDSGSFKYAHCKLDGIWVEVGGGSVITSLPSDITDKVAWVPSIRAARVSGLTWYGELHVPGEPASFVKSALKHEDERLLFTPFASPSLSHDGTLEDIDVVATRHKLNIAPYFILPTGVMFEPEAAMIPGIEGFVFKNGNLLDWHKWKPVKTIDVVVSGFLDGNGKYIGLIGAMACSVYRHVTMGNRTMSTLVEIANVSGMDDRTRILVSDDEEGCLGRVAEVAYQYVGSKGRLRHPRFMRWRDDKSALSCDLTQDPDLEEYYTS